MARAMAIGLGLWLWLGLGIGLGLRLGLWLALGLGQGLGSVFTFKRPDRFCRRTKFNVTGPVTQKPLALRARKWSGFTNVIIMLRKTWNHVTFLPFAVCSTVHVKIEKLKLSNDWVKCTSVL